MFRMGACKGCAQRREALRMAANKAKAKAAVFVKRAIKEPKK